MRSAKHHSHTMNGRKNRYCVWNSNDEYVEFSVDVFIALLTTFSFNLASLEGIVFLTKIKFISRKWKLSSRVEGRICIFLFWLESEIQSKRHSQFRFLHNEKVNFFLNTFCFKLLVLRTVFRNYPLTCYGNIICKLDGYLPELTTMCVCVCVCNKFTAN